MSSRTRGFAGLATVLFLVVTFIAYYGLIPFMGRMWGGVVAVALGLAAAWLTQRMRAGRARTEV